MSETGGPVFRVVAGGDRGLTCSVQADGRTVSLTASDGPAARDELLAALEAARDAGDGECVWQTPTGDYRWVLRRRDGRLTVVALWSSGTVTGWQHVLHTETDFEAFAEQVRAELTKPGEASPPLG